VKRFKLLVCGENFLLRSEGALKRIGFYTMRTVEAPDVAEAECRVLAALWRDVALPRVMLNDPLDPPRVFVEEVDEIAPGESPRARPSELTFFEDPRILH